MSSKDAREQLLLSKCMVRLFRRLGCHVIVVRQREKVVDESGVLEKKEVVCDEKT